MESDVIVQNLKKRKKETLTNVKQYYQHPYLHLNGTCYTFNMFQGAKLISHR